MNSRLASGLVLELGSAGRMSRPHRGRTAVESKLPSSCCHVRTSEDQGSVAGLNIGQGTLEKVYWVMSEHPRSLMLSNV